MSEDEKLLNAYATYDRYLARKAVKRVVFSDEVVAYASLSVEEAAKLKKQWEEAWSEHRSYHEQILRHIGEQLPQPRPRRDLIDGITPAKCLERYEANMRAEGEPEWLLTPAQKQRASELWSANLRYRVAIQRESDAERERSERIVVDDDRWED